MTYAHNVLGRPKRITLPNGAQTQYEYSPTGKLLRATSPMGGAIQYAYDGEDNLLRQTDPLGRVTEQRYDRANRMSWVIVKDSLGNIVNNARHTYNLAGRRTGTVDPNGNTTTLEYDAAGRVLAETDPLGKRVLNEYGDPRGLLTALVNGRGQMLQMGYDAAARLTNLFFPDDTVIGHNLDPNGNRLVTIGRNLEETRRTFDRLNRLTSRTDEFGNTIQYEHDPVGNLVGLTYSDGKKVAYEYDALNRMVKVTDWEGRATTYSYDDVGRLAASRLPDGSNVTYTYDLSNRLIAIIDVAPDGSTIYSTRYTLDAAGLRVSENTQLPLEPLVTSLLQDRTHNGANQLVSDGRDGFEYDGDGNIVRGTVGGVPMEMSYNEMNQLVRAGLDTYRYDADGLRIEATVGCKTVRYVQDPASSAPRVLEEHDADGNIVARYVYGIGLIGREEVGGRQNRLSIYHFDSRGSAVALTDQTGRMTDRYAYSPFGKLVRREGKTVNPFTYCGRHGVVDDGNGLYFMRNRYYEPTLMRFIQKDQLFAGSPTSPQTLNRYAYALGNPIHGIDPDGAWFGLDDLIMMIGGAIVNVVSVLIGDLVSGEWSGWEEYVGAFVGGMVMGEVLLHTGNPILASTLGAVVENLLTFGLEWASGKRNAENMSDPMEIFNTVFGFVFDVGGTALGAYAFGKLGAKLGSKGLQKTLWNLARRQLTWGMGGFFMTKLVFGALMGGVTDFLTRGDRWGGRDYLLEGTATAGMFLFLAPITLF